ncbi:MAG: helix-turn-helix domain-containing protein [Alphaproteobacteria bacterium]|nr:helix-turn-helix domain-containing protein [Alphaproteobacteria bacterium]
MLKTAEEVRLGLALAVRVRRIALRLSQEEAAKRAGMGIATWKRMEAHGPSSVEHLIHAAITLSCEEGFDQLFPPPAASSMDELLWRQAEAAGQKLLKRAPRKRAGP